MKKGTLIFAIITFLIVVSMLIFGMIVYGFISLIKSQGEVCPHIYQEEQIEEEYKDSICECR